MRTCLTATPRRRLAVALGLALVLHAGLISLLRYAPTEAKPGLPPPAEVAGDAFMLLEYAAPAPARVTRVLPMIAPTVEPVVSDPVARIAEKGEGPVTGVGPGGGAAKPLLEVSGSPGGRPPRVVYLLDSSGSMGPSGRLERAKAEVLLSLRACREAVVQVVCYNHNPSALLPEGAVPLTPGLLARVEERFAEVGATGKTDHGRAWARALELRPDIVFWLTDADDLTPAQVAAITGRNGGRAALHVVELTGRTRRSESLERLAADNRGTYRQVSAGD